MKISGEVYLAELNERVGERHNRPVVISDDKIMPITTLVKPNSVHIKINCKDHYILPDVLLDKSDIKIIQKIGILVENNFVDIKD